MLIRFFACVVAVVMTAAPMASSQCSAAVFGSLTADPLVASGSFTIPPGCAVDNGYLGPPLPNSFTDAQGNWTAFGPVPWPALVGLTTYVEVFVIDFNAPNGLFHQPKMVSVTYVN